MWSHLPSSNSLEVERQNWLKTAHREEERRVFPMTVSSHALLLLVDIEYGFRAGAWVSVIVLSQACIEATFRQLDSNNYTSPSIDFLGNDEELNWLRTLRNEVLHSKEPGSISKLWKLPSDDIPACHAALEPDAKRAVQLAFREIYKMAKWPKSKS
jgi:hypothetical protein